MSLIIAKYRFISLLRYPENLIYYLIYPIVTIVLAYALQQIIDVETFSSYSKGLASYIAFIYSGIALFLILELPISISGQVYDEIRTGYLETTLLATNRISKYFVGVILGDMLFAAPFILIMSVLAVIYAGSAGKSNLFLLLFTLVVTIMGVFGFSLLAIGLALRYKMISNTLSMFNFIREFLDGTIFPVLLLTPSIRFISYAIPSTWYIDLWRISLFGTGPILNLTLEIVLATTSSIILLLVGYAFVEREYKTAIRKGLLLTY